MIGLLNSSFPSFAYVPKSEWSVRTLDEQKLSTNHLPGLWMPDRLAVLCAAGRSGFAVEDGQHALDRFLAIGPARGSRQVELQTLFLGEADEFPVIGEPPAVDVAEVVEDDPAGLADHGGQFEVFDEVLGDFVRKLRTNNGRRTRASGPLANRCDLWLLLK